MAYLEVAEQIKEQISKSCIATVLASSLWQLEMSCYELVL